DRITIIYNVKIIKKVFMLLMKKATGDDEDEEKQKLESKSDYARALSDVQRWATSDGGRH
ncbi:MAG: hypothetical protein M3M88_05530, partial [Thermoproteota archaeon]|nr:hypothetical protein [Thermoproteota archaeon]